MNGMQDMMPIFEIVRDVDTPAREAEFRPEKALARSMEVVILHDAESWTYMLDLDEGLVVSNPVLSTPLPYQPTEILSLTSECRLDIVVIETATMAQHRLRLLKDIPEYLDHMSIALHSSKLIVNVWIPQSTGFSGAHLVPPRMLIARIWLSKAWPCWQEYRDLSLPTAGIVLKLCSMHEQYTAVTLSG